jgi:hypothetical protein
MKLKSNFNKTGLLTNMLYYENLTTTFTERTDILFENMTVTSFRVTSPFSSNYSHCSPELPVYSFKQSGFPVFIVHFLNDISLQKVYTYDPFILQTTCDQYLPKIKIAVASSIPSFIEVASDVPKITILGPVKEKG